VFLAGAGWVTCERGELRRFTLAGHYVPHTQEVVLRWRDQFGAKLIALYGLATPFGVSGYVGRGLGNVVGFWWFYKAECVEGE